MRKDLLEVIPDDLGLSGHEKSLHSFKAIHPVDSEIPLIYLDHEKTEIHIQNIYKTWEE